MVEYQANTHQVFRLRSSTSVNHRNTEIKTADGTLLIPKNTGQRKSYFGKSTECKAEVKALVTWNDDENKFMVRVTGYSTHHNHRVAQAVYDNHPSVRRVEEPVLLAFVDVMQSSGSKPKKIMQFLQEKTDKNVTLRDIHNIVARMWEGRRGNTTVEERLESLLYTLGTEWVSGQYVQHSLMENEGAECLFDAINAFKFLILCHFHLKKYIRSEMAKTEYDGLTSFNFDQVDDAIDMMRMAATLDDYTKYLKYTYYLLDNVQYQLPDPNHPFLKYFIKNWDQQKERWALLETSRGHIKEILKPEMTVDEGVDTLMFLQASAEMEYSKRITDVGYMRYQGADKELDLLSREVSTHAYRMIQKQYLQAKDRTTHYEMNEVTSNMFILSTRSGKKSYHVDTSKYRCSPRWKLSSKLNQPAEEEDAPSNEPAHKSFQVRDPMMIARKHLILNGTTKFKTACRRATHIADIMSRDGTFVFNEMMAALDKFEDIIKDGVAHWLAAKVSGLIHCQAHSYLFPT
ncbi:hypothetical protein PHMEG_00029567, partial [Phytophthora megakarya]